MSEHLNEPNVFKPVRPGRGWLWKILDILGAQGWGNLYAVMDAKGVDSGYDQELQDLCVANVIGYGFSGDGNCSIKELMRQPISPQDRIDLEVLSRERADDVLDYIFSSEPYPYKEPSFEQRQQL